MARRRVVVGEHSDHPRERAGDVDLPSAQQRYAVEAEVPCRDRREVRIELLNEAGQPAHRYVVHRCWVSEFQGLPDLDAGGNAVAIEHVKLENEGWEHDLTLSEPQEV